MYTLEDIKAVDMEVAQAITDEFERQSSHIELIASENWVSEADAINSICEFCLAISASIAAATSVSTAFTLSNSYIFRTSKFYLSFA